MKLKEWDIVPIEHVSSSYINMEGISKWLKQSESLKRLTGIRHPSVGWKIPWSGCGPSS